MTDKPHVTYMVRVHSLSVTACKGEEFMRLSRLVTIAALPAVAMSVLTILPQGAAEAAGTSSSAASGSASSFSPRSAAVNPDFFYYLKATGVEVRFYPYGERICVYDKAKDGHHVEADYATSNGLLGTLFEYDGNGSHLCVNLEIPESGYINFRGYVMEGNDEVRHTDPGYAPASNV